MIRVLVVDDSALVRKLLGKVFGAEPDFTLRFARNGAEALQAIHAEKPDVVTLDIQMPDMDGLECLDRIMIEQPCPVVMVSSLSTKAAALTVEALRRGAVDFVPKPAGAMSLGVEAMGRMLVEKTRAAAQARLSTTYRLRERVRHRMGREMAPPSPVARPVARPAAPHGLVLLGASTGGPPALETLLLNLPEDFPWPLLVAQHMPASFTGPLARRLDQLCPLNVMEVTGPMTLAPGCVYIGAGDADMVVARRDGALMAMPMQPQPGYPWHPSTDRLVRSAMREAAPGQLIGVLLTGMGNDGAEAMAALRQAGGRTIAESEESAVVWGMPGALVKADGADFVLPLAGIAPVLQKLAA